MGTSDARDDPNTVVGADMAEAPNAGGTAPAPRAGAPPNTGEDGTARAPNAGGLPNAGVPPKAAGVPNPDFTGVV